MSRQQRSAPSEHTPKWKILPGATFVVFSGDRRICYCYSTDSDFTDEEAAEHARFIVRACNSHKQLLAALKAANELLEAWGDWVNNADIVPEHAAETGVSEERVAVVFDQVHDALAAAEGTDHA